MKYDCQEEMSLTKLAGSACRAESDRDDPMIDRPTTARDPNMAGGREVAVTFASRAGVYAVSILTQSLLAYILLPEGRGAYAVCVTFAFLLSVVFTFSIDRGAQYYAVAKQISLSQSLFLALAACLVGSAVAVAAALPLIHGNLAFFQKAPVHSFHLSLTLVPLISMSAAVELQLAGLRRFGPLAVFLPVQSLVVVLATVALVRQMGLGIDGALLALIAGHVFMTGACLWELRKHCGTAFELPSLSGCRRVLGYGLRYHVMRVGNEVEPRVGVFALGMLTGSADIGLFAAVSVLMLRLGLISSAVGIVLYPRVASGAIKQPEKLVGLNLRLVCLATGGALAVLPAISTPLIRVLLSEAFLPAAPLMWILAPGILAYAGAGMFITYFSGVNQPGVCSCAVWLGLTANIASFLALYPALGPALGIEAAAWAMTIGLIVRSAYLGIVFHRQTGATLRSIWLPRRADFAYLWTAGQSVVRMRLRTR